MPASTHGETPAASATGGEAGGKEPGIEDAIAAPPAGPRPDHLRALAAVARGVSGVAAPAEWGHRALAAVAEATGWERVFLFRLLPDTQRLELVAAHGASAEEAEEFAVLRLDGLSLSAVAIRRRQPVILDRTRLPPELAASAGGLSLPSLAVFPLIARGNVLGTLTLADTTPRRVDQSEADFLAAVADTLATGFESARLFAELRAREARARFLARVSELFGSTLDPQRVLQSVVERCVGVLGDACGIFLNPPDPARDDRLTIGAIHHRRPEMVARFREVLEALPYRLHEGVAGKVAATGHPVLLADLRSPGLTLPPISRERAERMGARSGLVAPLRTQRGVLGILVAFTTSEPDAPAQAPLFGVPAGGTLTEAELALAMEVCDRAASALENARLYAHAEEARLWLRTVFNQMIDGVLVFDARGHLIEANEAAAQLFGVPLAPGTQIPGRAAPLDLRRPDGTLLPEAQHPSRLALATGRPVTNVDLLVVRPSGEPVEVSASAAPLHDEQGRLLGAVMVVRDVTELRRLERAKENFLSVTSHELRTPLTPLKGLTEMLLRMVELAEQHTAPFDFDRAQRYLRTIDSQVDRLAGLVNDLLDVSRIQTGRLRIRPAPTDLVALVGAVLQRFEALATIEVRWPRGRRPRPSTQAGPAPAASLSSEAAPALLAFKAVAREEAWLRESGFASRSERAVPGAVTPLAGAFPQVVFLRREVEHRILFVPQVTRLIGRWDPARVEQVLTNLLSNAIKYSPEGGEIVVTLWHEPGERGPQAHLTVKDPGIGIPADQLGDLYRPFMRLGNAPVERFGGLGLGLYIAYDLVERHGGQLWAESPGPGLGATFHVTLPLRPPPQRAAPPPPRAIAF